MGPRGTYLQTGSNNRHSKVFQRGAVIQFVSSNVGGQFYYKVYSYCITASLSPVPFLIFMSTLTLVLLSFSGVAEKIYPDYIRFAFKNVICHQQSGFRDSRRDMFVGWKCHNTFHSEVQKGKKIKL